jgi:hypothetical protein
MTMKTYRCKHAVEALRWTDTDENREAFANWFDEHDSMFETRGDVIVLPNEARVIVGDWVLYLAGDFVPMSDREFGREYEEAA